MNNNNNSGYARGDSKPANVGLGLGYRKPPVTEDLIINNNRRNGEAHVSRNEAASGVYDELVEWHQGNSTMCSSNDNDRSGSLPEMAGTQPPSPVGVAQPEASARSGNNKEEERGQAVTMLYSLTSCPDDARHLVAGSKEVIEELTGHRADDYIDLFVAEEKWFNEEILIFALCLMNRITATHPQWFDEHSNNYYMVTVRAVDSEDDKLSSVLNGSTSAPSLESSGSDVHHHYQHHHNHYHNHNQQGSAEHRFVVPAVVTQEGTTNDRSGSHHSQDYASGRMTNHSDCSSYNASITTSGSRVGGAGGSCRWTPHNTPRCLVALLLLSAKFHGDIIYGTSTISEVAERVRARQKDRIDNNNNNNNNSNSNNRNSNNNNNSKQLVYPRLTAARLGECETRIWKELDCSVFVHLAEYEQCYEHVLAAAF